MRSALYMHMRSLSLISAPNAKLLALLKAATVYGTKSEEIAGKDNDVAPCTLFPLLSLYYRVPNLHPLLLLNTASLLADLLVQDGTKARLGEMLVLGVSVGTMF